MSRITVRAKVTGKVQGVGFRWWTEARARALGLDGWVRNEPTGSVSVLLQGERGAVEAMLAELWGGPAAAVVRDVQHAPVADAAAEAGFAIRR